MPSRAPETMPLLPAQHSNSFIQKLIYPLKKFWENLTAKSFGIAVTSAVSVVTYYNPAYQAGASVADGLKEITAASGIGTNFLFNIQAYRELLEQCPRLLKTPAQLSAAIFFSIMCVAPNIFMNIVDEEGNYVDAPLMTLQIVSALLNVGVNVVGSMELINGISALFKNQTDLQKEKFIEEINLAFEKFTRKHCDLDPTEPLNLDTQGQLISLLTANNDLSLREKISYYSLNTGLGLFSIPQFSAYLLISYFGMRDLSEKKFGGSHTIGMFLGFIAAIGNGIPGAGFTIKGVLSSSKKLMSMEKPSLLAIFFALPALFSGFTTHKAMADSLKELGYSGNIAEALKWIANLGAALIYNLPQMLALADNLNTAEGSNQLTDLKKNLEDQIKNLDSSNLQDFRSGLRNNVMGFFNSYPAAGNSDTHHYPLHAINSSRL